MEYIKQIESRAKILTIEEQIDRYNKMKNGDMQAREDLINSNLLLALSIAIKFHKTNKKLDVDDLISSANIAMVKAVDKWNPDRGKLTTLVTVAVTNDLISIYNRSKFTSAISINNNAVQNLNKIKSGDISNMNYNTIKALEGVLNLVPVAIEEVLKIENENNEYNTRCLADVIGLAEAHITDSTEKNIFFSWLNNFNYTTTSKILGYNREEIKLSVKKTKKKLKKIAKTLDK